MTKYDNHILIGVFAILVILAVSYATPTFQPVENVRVTKAGW